MAYGMSSSSERSGSGSEGRDFSHLPRLGAKPSVDADIALAF